MAMLVNRMNPSIFDIPDIVRLILDYLPDIRVAQVSRWLLGLTRAHKDNMYWGRYQNYGRQAEYIYRYGSPKMLELIKFDAMNALASTASAGNLSMLEHLRRTGVDIHADDIAMKCACLHGQLDVVRYLHEHGADLVATVASCFTYAGMRGQLDVVKYLYGTGTVTEFDVNQTIMFAHNCGQMDVVGYLRGTKATHS